MSGFDLVLCGGTVVDGTGAAPVRADVGVVDGVIAAIGELPTADSVVYDVDGRTVCPGFVDVHTHSDLALLSNPLAHSKVRQGVTTEVVGNCGLGVAPVVPGSDPAALREAVSYLDLDPEIAWIWTDVPGHLEALAKAQPAVNVAALVGHLPLHAGVAGYDDRAPTPAELDRMRGLLGEALDAGAVGLSTGLMYAPLTFVGPDELRALGSVVADRDGLFAWHLRDYADALVPAVRQALDVAERTGCRTQLSHLVAVGERNWPAMAAALELIDDARERGLDVAMDVYPYLAGNAPLSQRLPAWAQAGGAAVWQRRLDEPDVVSRIRAVWDDDALDWSDVTVNAAPADEVVGRTVPDLAAEQGLHPDLVAVGLLREFGNAVTMVAGGRDAANLVDVLTHPASVVGSDGQALDPDGPTGAGMPHPRSYGCYPRLFDEFVGSGVLSMPEAVAKCTGRAAARIGLTDRGTVAAGLAADLVVVDTERIADRTTFADPQQFPDGIELVVVNGRVVVDHRGHTGVRPGAVLSRSRRGMP